MELNFNPVSEPWKLFSWLKKEASFTHSGLEADWLVEYDETNKRIIVAFDKTNGQMDWLLNLCFMPLTVILLFMFAVAYFIGGIFIPVFLALAVCEVMLAIFVIIKFHPKTLFKLTFGKFKCHAGMALIYSSIREELFSSLYKAMGANNCSDVLVCGWSQGGGLSEVFAMDFYTSTEKKAKMITFGALKTAWLSRSVNLSNKATAEGSAQYENGSDLVPKLPFTIWGFFSGKYCVHIGERFRWFKIFKTKKYHTAYDSETLYSGEGQ